MAHKSSDKVTFRGRKFTKRSIKGRKKGGLPTGTILLIPRRTKRKKKR